MRVLGRQGDRSEERPPTARPPSPRNMERGESVIPERAGPPHPRPIGGLEYLLQTQEEPDELGDLALAAEPRPHSLAVQAIGAQRLVHGSEPSVLGGPDVDLPVLKDGRVEPL